MGVAHGALAGLFAPRISALRIDRMVLPVRLARRAVEDVVGRDVDQRQMLRSGRCGDDSGAVAVHPERLHGVALGLVHGGVGRGVDDRGRLVRGDGGGDRRRVADVSLAVSQSHHGAPATRSNFDQVASDLAAGTEHHDLGHGGRRLSGLAGDGELNGGRGDARQRRGPFLCNLLAFEQSAPDQPQHESRDRQQRDEPKHLAEMQRHDPSPWSDANRDASVDQLCHRWQDRIGRLERRAVNQAARSGERSATRRIAVRRDALLPWRPDRAKTTKNSKEA